MLEGGSMKEIEKKQLEKINGGFSAWMALGIASAVIFIAGVLDGIVRPKGCSERKKLTMSL